MPAAPCPVCGPLFLWPDEPLCVVTHYPCGTTLVAVREPNGVHFTIQPTIPGLNFTFDSQARQFPAAGPAGLTYEHVTASDSTPVDVILHREPDGLLTGIAYHYPVNCTLQAAGSANLVVHPDYQRAGIGLILLTALIDRHNLDLTAQQWTTAGAHLLNRYLNGR